MGDRTRPFPPSIKGSLKAKRATSELMLLVSFPLATLFIFPLKIV